MPKGSLTNQASALLFQCFHHALAFWQALVLIALSEQVQFVIGAQFPRFLGQLDRDGAGVDGKEGRDEGAHCLGLFFFFFLIIDCS